MLKKMIPVPKRDLSLKGVYFENCRPNSLDLFHVPSRYGNKLIYPTGYLQEKINGKS